MTITEQDIERAREWWKKLPEHLTALSPMEDLLAAYAAHVTAEKDAEIERRRAAERETSAAYKRGLEDAARIAENPDRTGRDWVPGSFWDTLIKETAARIRALAKTDGHA